MSDRKTFSVEEVAKKLNVTPRTLHYYEEMGLISPVTRTAGGHRIYDEPVVDKLNHILQIKDSLGISLQEIKEIMEVEDALERLKESYKGINNEHEKQLIVDEYIQHLKGIIGKIDDKISSLEEMKNAFTERLDKTKNLRQHF